MKNAKVYAMQHPTGMAIYVEYRGETNFVMLHRRSTRLYFYLCGKGRSLHDLKFYRPGRNRGEQLFGKSLEYIVKVTEYVLAETAA